MSAWDHNIVCIVTAPLNEIAAHVGRALDSDIGGAENFGIRASATGQEPATHLVMASPCTAGFASAAPYLLDADFLLGSIERDYALRWPDLTTPTLDEVQAFVDGCTLVVDQDVFAVLADAGLQIIIASDAE